MNATVGNEQEEIASSSSGTTNAATNENPKGNDQTAASTANVASNADTIESNNVGVSSEVMIPQEAGEGNNQQESVNHDSQELAEPPAINEGVDASVSNNDEEHQQNEQHIENAGIDPNYPLVLVRRVSIPSNGESPRPESSAENNMEEDVENAAAVAAPAGAEGGNSTRQAPSPAEIVAIFNSISAAGSDNDDEDEEVDDTDNEDAWSEEDEDEAAFLENPNFRGFANQFEAIRNMIAHTRRSMAEAEANFGPIPRNSLMQRFRRILFILNNRRRRLIRLGLGTPDVELPEVEANAEMDATNDDTSDNDGDGENAEVPANEEGNNLTMEQEEEMNENAVRFDTNLPAEHTYMGSNMNRVSGVNYLEVDQYVKIRLFLHQHVLFPGEVLPFMVDSSTTIIEGDIDAQNGIMFGVCFPALSEKITANGDNNGSNSEEKEQLLYGVTCQIYELGEDERSNTLIKSRALQRFVTKPSDLTV